MVTCYENRFVVSSSTWCLRRCCMRSGFVPTMHQFPIDDERQRAMKKIHRTRARENQREGHGEGDAHSLHHSMPMGFLSPSQLPPELIASPPFLSSSTRLCFHSGKSWPPWLSLLLFLLCLWSCCNLSDQLLL
ncbi:hypothetical protein PIB30_030492 [Stylosanthes scabra]|uniref:Uncharacterized protein n=1 Tax=Stylosanthes scabra TaxID=79078 RepID=A0ABU6W9M4_9FABA|nr:hypothetical protein [Stylosanthes scabra]